MNLGTLLFLPRQNKQDSFWLIWKFVKKCGEQLSRLDSQILHCYRKGQALWVKILTGKILLVPIFVQKRKLSSKSNQNKPNSKVTNLDKTSRSSILSQGTWSLVKLTTKRSVNFKMSFWCLQIDQKSNEFYF